MVTITFCFIMLRLLFIIMHVFISWCYKSSCLNFRFACCLFFSFFFHSRFLLFSRLPCYYLQVVICRYKITRNKEGLLLFSEFFVTPSNTRLLRFKVLMGLHFLLKILAYYLISDLRWHTHKIRSPSLGKGHV